MPSLTKLPQHRQSTVPPVAGKQAVSFLPTNAEVKAFPLHEPPQLQNNPPPELRQTSAPVMTQQVAGKHSSSCGRERRNHLAQEVPTLPWMPRDTVSPGELGGCPWGFCISSHGRGGEKHSLRAPCANLTQPWEVTPETLHSNNSAISHPGICFSLYKQLSFCPLLSSTG